MGSWVYPATHLNRIPYTHSGRIRARGYLGISSYPLKPNSIHPLTRVVFGGHGWVGGWTSHIYLARWMTICDIPQSVILLRTSVPYCRFCPHVRGLLDEWVFGYIRLVGLECRFASYLRGVLDKWVFGYTQMQVCPLFKGCFGKEGIWVYPAIHSNRLPYTHSGRIRASGYLGVPSYPLKWNYREWVFAYTQRPTQIEFRIPT